MFAIVIITWQDKRFKSLRSTFEVFDFDGVQGKGGGGGGGVIDKTTFC